MFDTYHRTINRGPDHVSVSVTEKRAPTDQSVALLKEMEKAAEEKWKGGIRLEGCPFDAIVHHHRDYMTADYKFIVIYKLGSQRREVRFDVRDSFSSIESERANDICKAAIKAVSEDLAIGILEKPLSAAIKDMLFGTINGTQRADLR